ncbi:MAG: heparinase II/III domain-containing protein [Limnochordia bacterium]|jgi:hypothetical protein
MMFLDDLRILSSMVLLVIVVLLLQPAVASAATKNPREGILWQVPEGIVPNLTLEHPRILYTPEDVARARANVSSSSWGKSVSDSLVRSLQSFMLTDEEIRELMPEQGAYYLYLDHYMLCPDGSRMLWAGLSNPGKCLCNGKLLPDQDHPDDGTGWQDDKGDTYYFVARWNGGFVEYISGVLDQLAQAYALTGEPKYAHKAAVILDALATIYPTATEGPLDYPGLRPGYEGGRLERPYYQTARVLLRYATAVDLIWNSGELEQQSQTNPALTVRENIVYNMLLNGADYCYREANKRGYIDQLHNGTADYNKAILAVGSLLGIDIYIEWGVNGPTSLEIMLANNINRDGMYFETTTLYADVVRTLYAEIAELLYKLRSSKYPNGVNMYDNPRFAALYTSKETMFVAGRNPMYGDSAPDEASSIGKPYNEAAAKLLARLAMRVSDPEQREYYWQKVADAVDVPVFAVIDFWGVMNVSEVPQIQSTRADFSQPSGVVGGSGFVIMRSGKDRGVVMRYGPTLNHGQYDELSLLIYANGREMSFDPGYGDAHYRTGFLHQTVAHLTTTVNQQRQLNAHSAGGSLEYFTAVPGMSIASACDVPAYQHLGVSYYCRTLAYADTSSSHSYLVDIFRIQGGSTRDYSFHSRGMQFQITGVDMGAQQPGSVASPNYTWHNQIGEDLRVIPHRNEAYSWNAPPGNGYGFLGFPSTGRTDGMWSAAWSGDRAKLRLTMLPATGREVIVAQAPSPMGDTKYVLARDRGERSQYVAVIDATGGNYQVAQVEPLQVAQSAVTGHTAMVAQLNASQSIPTTQSTTGGFAPTAFSVELAEPQIAAAPAGSRVYDVYLSTLDGMISASSSLGRFATDGEMAMVRLAGNQPIAFHMAKGTTLSANDWTITGVPKAITGKVVAVDYAAGSLLVTASEQLSEAILGEYVYVSHERYDHSSPYRISGVSKEGEYYRIRIGPNSFELAMGIVNGQPSGQNLPNMTNLPYSRNVSRGGATTYYDGKLVVNQNGAQTIIQRVQSDFAGLTVDDTGGFTQGDTLTILDVKAGDDITIPTAVHLTQLDPYTYYLQSMQPILLAVPDAYTDQVYVAGAGAEFSAAKQKLADGRTWYVIPPGTVKIGRFAVLEAATGAVIDADAPDAAELQVMLTELITRTPIQNAVVTASIDGASVSFAEQAPGVYAARLPKGIRMGSHQLCIEAAQEGYLIQPIEQDMDVRVAWRIRTPEYVDAPLGGIPEIRAQIEGASSDVLAAMVVTAEWAGTVVPMSGDGRGNFTAGLPMLKTDEEVFIRAMNQNGFVQTAKTAVMFKGGEIRVSETEIQVPVNGQVAVHAGFVNSQGTLLKGSDIPNAYFIHGFLNISEFRDEDGDGTATALITAPGRVGKYSAYIQADGCESVEVTLIVTEN